MPRTTPRSDDLAWELQVAVTISAPEGLEDSAQDLLRATARAAAAPGTSPEVLRVHALARPLLAALHSGDQKAIDQALAAAADGLPDITGADLSYPSP